MHQEDQAYPGLCILFFPTGERAGWSHFLGINLAYSAITINLSYAKWSYICQEASAMPTDLTYAWDLHYD